MRKYVTQVKQFAATPRDPNIISDTDINVLSKKFLEIIGHSSNTYDDLKQFIESQCKKGGQILIWDTKNDKAKMPLQVKIKYKKITETTDDFTKEYFKKFKNPENNFKLFLVFVRTANVNELTTDKIEFKVEMDASNKPPVSPLPEDLMDMDYVEVEGGNFNTFDKVKLGMFLASFENNSSVRDLLKEHLVSF